MVYLPKKDKLENYNINLEELSEKLSKEEMVKLLVREPLYIVKLDFSSLVDLKMLIWLQIRS